MKTITHLHIAKTLRPLYTAAFLCAAAMAFSAVPAQAEAIAKSSKRCQMHLLQRQPAPARTFTSPSLRDNHRSYNPLTGTFEEASPFGPRSNE